MKQHTTPLIIQGELVTRLKKKDDKSYDENWIQELCYRCPSALPIDKFEPSFSDPISICRELHTESGPCDLIYLDKDGFITIGECKLWRNHEARREVVAQILDYAKDIAKWDYKKFEAACIKARKGDETSLYEIMQDHFPDIEELEFIDQVEKNLRHGRFLLLVIGDRIRENMEDLVDYLQGNNGLGFTLALVEISVYEKPSSDELFVTPRVLAKTKEIPRTFIVVENHSIEEKEPGKDESKRQKNFYEQLAKTQNQQVADDLKDFIGELVEEYDLMPKFGGGDPPSSLSIKSANDKLNYACVKKGGNVWFPAIVRYTADRGDRQIGVDYLESLAEMVDAKLDNKNSDEWHWNVKRGDELISINEYLKHRSKWKELIGNTISRIWEVGEE